MFTYGVWTGSSTTPVPQEATSYLADFDQAAKLDCRHDLHICQSLQATIQTPDK